MYVRPKDAADRRVLENPEYAAQILEEANIKRLVLIDDETSLVKPTFKPDAKKLGPRAGKYLKAIAQVLAQADPKAVLSGNPYKVEVDGQTFELAPDEIITSFEGPENLKSMLEQGTFLALDTTVTPELAREGLARDFNRLVQDQRKAMNLNISDRIVVSYFAPPRVAEAIAEHESYLAARTSRRSVGSECDAEWRSEALAKRRRRVRHDNAGVSRIRVSEMELLAI